MEQTVINEVWRSVDGYMNYQVSNIGRVRNATNGRILKATLNNGYYKVTVGNHEGQKRYCVHTLVAQEFLDKPDSKHDTYYVDHINRNKLDNQVCNLRYATASQNMMNKTKQIGRKTSSQYKGVTLEKKSGKWIAQIRIGGKRNYLGIFTSEEEAAMAYDLKAEEAHGEFAVLNF